MNKFNFFHFPITVKITLSALFLALAVILQKLLAVNYIPIVPFLRISFGGPAVIILASILFGPLFGFVVGAGSDLLGYLLFDPKSYLFMPQITMIYALLGFLPYFLFIFIKKIHSKKLMLTALISVVSMILIILSIYLFTNETIHLYNKIYAPELWVKFLIMFLAVILFAGLIVFTILLSKKKEKEGELPFNIYQLSLGMLIIEIIVMVIFGTLMKGWAFGFATYPAILICQLIVLFVNIPLNTVIITLFLKILTKMMPTVLNTN